MANLNFKNIFIEDAKAILAVCYESDTVGTYNNDFTFSGNYLTAQITKNETESGLSILPKFDVHITSSAINEVSLKEKFEDYLFAL